MKMTSQHSKIRHITPYCPKFNYILKKCIRQVFRCSMQVSNRKVIYKGNIDQRSMPKNIPTLAPKPLHIYTCHASQVNSQI